MMVEWVLSMTANVKQPRLVDRCGTEANTGEKDGKTRAQENGVLFKRTGPRRELAISRWNLPRIDDGSYQAPADIRLGVDSEANVLLHSRNLAETATSYKNDSVDIDSQLLLQPPLRQFRAEP